MALLMQLADRMTDIGVPVDNGTDDFLDQVVLDQKVVIVIVNPCNMVLHVVPPTTPAARLSEFIEKSKL